MKEALMSLEEAGIEHKKLADRLVATIRFNLKERQDLRAVLDKLTQTIPSEHIAGPPFCILHFVTSVKEGSDAEIGFPVTQTIETDEIKTRVLPAMQVLSIVHKDPREKLNESYRTLYGCASNEHGLISDEFVLEVFPNGDPEGDEVEIQFILHDWNGLLGANLERVLGREARERVTQGNDALTLESTVDERFQWAKGMIDRLDDLADKDQKYDVLSSCAHVFPSEPIEKARAIYEDAKAKTSDPLKAIDAVIAFMDEDAAWATRPSRKGTVIYATKNPRDPQGYKEAKTAAEKRKAYCFCPLVRNHLDEGMPVTFCYCGSGWYRRQWEGITGKPVSIQVLKSILKGDDVCRFAVQLSDDL
jgi:effector-binding domain-containing protein